MGNANSVPPRQPTGSQPNSRWNTMPVYRSNYRRPDVVMTDASTPSTSRTSNGRPTPPRRTSSPIRSNTSRIRRRISNWSLFRSTSSLDNVEPSSISASERSSGGMSSSTRQRRTRSMFGGSFFNSSGPITLSSIGPSTPARMEYMHRRILETTASTPAIPRARRPNSFLMPRSNPNRRSMSLIENTVAHHVRPLFSPPPWHNPRRPTSSRALARERLGEPAYPARRPRSDMIIPQRRSHPTPESLSGRRATRSRDSDPSHTPQVSVRDSGTLSDALARPGDVVSPQPGEDQAAMLSRLLSIAAAATAASLVGNDNDVLRHARDVAVEQQNDNSDVVDGTFDGFLQALQGGRLAAALRNGGNEMGGGAPGEGPDSAASPLNFFRMFRFSTPVSIQGTEGQQQQEADGTMARMIPIIIVGIRSVPPRDGAIDQGLVPTFFDSLGTFDGEPIVEGDTTTASQISNEGLGPSISDAVAQPAPLTSIDILPTPQPEDSQAPRIPLASFVPLDQEVDDWTWSESTVVSPESNPPSASEISHLTSEANHPSVPATTPSNIATASNVRQNQGISLPGASLMEAMFDRLRGGPRYADGENEGGDRQRRRRSGWRPFASHTETTVEETDEHAAPAENAAESPTQTRSWIIYVLGGSYPENHPILTTPSLFTDAPTYEDMLMLSNFIGPAKPPTASAEEVQESGETITLEAGDPKLGERCQVCLSDYELGEIYRRLKVCGHVFHRECIDEWLTTGRNNCPLCRSSAAAITIEAESSLHTAVTDPGITQMSQSADVAMAIPVA